MHNNRWKKVMAGALSACMLATCVPGVTELGYFTQRNEVVQAATKKLSGKCGKKAKWEYNTKTKTLTISGTGAMYDYSNKAILEEEEVEYAKFPGWDSISSGIEKVVIGNGITKIGSYAFQEDHIGTVKIGKKVKTIGYGAFKNSTVTKVECGDALVEIGASAFFDCTLLTEITLGNKVKTIGGQAFEYCSSLKAVKSGENVVTINRYAFNGCSSLEKAELGKKVKTIETGAFSECGIQEVDFGENMETVGKQAFEDCSNLKKVKLGKNIKTIGNRAFINCKKLEDIETGDKLKSIGDGAFYDCDNLTKFDIGKSVKKVEDGAFGRCDNLSTINVHAENKYFMVDNNRLFDKNKTTLYWNDFTTNTTCYIDSTVKYLNGSVIYSEKLEAFEVSSENETYFAEDGLLYAKDGMQLLKCPEGKKGTVVISDKAIRMDVPVGYEKLGFEYRPFDTCEKIEKIVVGKNIKSMDAKFLGCTNLKEVVVDPENEYYASENGSILNKDKTKVIYYISAAEDGTYTVPDSVTFIAEDAFSTEDRTMPTRIVLSDGVKEFGYGMPNTVTSISFGKEYKSGYKWLSDYDNIVKEITISEENRNLKTKDGVLYTKDGSKLLYCPQKKEGTVTIDSETGTIGEYAFQYAKNITTINLPETITTIEKYAFSGANAKMVFCVPKGKKAFYKKLLTSKTGFKSTMTIKEAE